MGGGGGHNKTNQPRRLRDIDTQPPRREKGGNDSNDESAPQATKQKAKEIAATRRPTRRRAPPCALCVRFFSFLFFSSSCASVCGRSSCTSGSSGRAPPIYTRMPRRTHPPLSLCPLCLLLLCACRPINSSTRESRSSSSHLRQCLIHAPCIMRIQLLFRSSVRPSVRSLARYLVACLLNRSLVRVCRRPPSSTPPIRTRKQTK